jgi:hypothetical protein
MRDLNAIEKKTNELLNELSGRMIEIEKERRISAEESHKAYLKAPWCKKR